MKFNKATPWLPALLLLAGCPGPVEPPGPTPTAPRLNAIAVACTPATLEAGKSAQCTASASDQDGNPFTVDAYTWTSGDESLAKVDASGKVTTVAAGSGTVAIRASATASDATRQAQASLSVTPRPPTVHENDIIAAETWRVADNPHLVKDILTVYRFGSLTLEPGVVVRFAPKTGLTVYDGTLNAQGSAQAPIVLEGEDRTTRGSWNGLLFATKSMVANLDHVSVRQCGEPTEQGGCLVIEHQAAPVLRDVSVQQSGSVGVWVKDESGVFGAGSTRLSVTGSAGAAIVMAANQVDTLPSASRFSDNAPNAVQVYGHVERTQTWPNPGVPFVIPNEMYVDGDNALVTLTLSAGSVLRFGNNSRLLVNFNHLGVNESLGALVVNGTAEAPVLFTADSAQPQPGHWRGVQIATTIKTPGRISHATIEYAGAAPPENDFSTGTGNLNFIGSMREEDDSRNSFVVNDVIVQKSSRNGFFISDNFMFAPGSGRLTSRDNGTTPIAMEADLVHLLPKDFVFTGNKINAVEITYGSVLTSQTWPRLSVPYLVTGPDLSVVSPTSSGMTTLTLEPGTTVMFAPGTALRVGVGDQGRGALIAKGTRTEPIHFIADSTTAARGHWAGLHFWRAEGSELSFATVSNGGGKPIEGSFGVFGEGNLNVYRQIGDFVKNSSFSQAKGCAVTVSDGTRQYSTAVTSNFLSDQSGNIARDNGSNTQCLN